MGPPPQTSTTEAFALRLIGALHYGALKDSENETDPPGARSSGWLPALSPPGMTSTWWGRSNVGPKRRRVPRRPNARDRAGRTWESRRLPWHATHSRVGRRSTDVSRALTFTGGGRSDKGMTHHTYWQQDRRAHPPSPPGGRAQQRARPTQRSRSRRTRWNAPSRDRPHEHVSIPIGPFASLLESRDRDRPDEHGSSSVAASGVGRAACGPRVAYVADLPSLAAPLAQAAGRTAREPSDAVYERCWIAFRNRQSAHRLGPWPVLSGSGSVAGWRRRSQECCWFVDAAVLTGLERCYDAPACGDLARLGTRLADSAGVRLRHPQRCLSRFVRVVDEGHQRCLGNPR
jgi:hypothetical protein